MNRLTRARPPAPRGSPCRRPGSCTSASSPWKAHTGAREVHGSIRDLWASLQWERGFLGYPTANETSSTDEHGRGRFSTFEGGTIIWTPTAGAHAIHGAVPACSSSMPAR